MIKHTLPPSRSPPQKSGGEDTEETIFSQRVESTAELELEIHCLSQHPTNRPWPIDYSSSASPSITSYAVIGTLSARNRSVLETSVPRRQMGILHLEIDIEHVHQRALRVP
jgi:hypothetical protein